MHSMHSYGLLFKLSRFAKVRNGARTDGLVNIYSAKKCSTPQGRGLSDSLRVNA